MAIDLDADGIETLGIPTSGTPVLFDHDADGVRTGTGWVKRDDAWLVLDRNNNGRIDSGRELFGVDTVITITEPVIAPDGSISMRTVTRNARSGFEALATLDTGSGTAGSSGYQDGVFDAKDAQFSKVKLWQDLNQDGVSQTGELFSLVQKGLTSIGLKPDGRGVDLGNGNAITGQAVVTRSNGQTTVVDSVDLQAGNLDLASNPFYREFSDSITPTAAAQVLPDMAGSGVLRDLREAMSLGTPASAALVEKLKTFAAATTRDAQRAQLGDLIHAWAQTAPLLSTQIQNIDGEFERVLATIDTVAARWGKDLDRLDPKWKTKSLDVAAQTLKTAGLVRDARTWNSSTGNVPHIEFVWWTRSQLDLMEPTLAKQYADLERFNGTALLDRMLMPVIVANYEIDPFGGGRNFLLTAQFNQELMQEAYDALVDSVYAGLVAQTRLHPYLDTIGLTLDDDGVHFTTQALSDKLAALKGRDLRNALIDLVELNRYVQPTLQAVGFDGMGLLRTWIDALPPTSPLRTELSALGVLTDAAALPTEGTDLFIGDGSGNSFSAGEGQDIIDGGAGDDMLSAEAGDDVLLGRAGADQLLGGRGADTLIGGAGADGLYGDGYYGGDGGDDVLDGGTGDDSLVGGHGSDTYLFGRGDGQDVILNAPDTWNGGVDPTPGKQDVLKFKTGIQSSDVRASRSGDDLILTIAGTDDRITLSSYFSADGAAFAVDRIEFDDAIWTLAQVKVAVLNSSAGNDVITGYETADTLNGAAGNDTLSGRGGNDTLSAGDGDDIVSGDAGNDKASGGNGADLLEGGEGNDTLDAGAHDDQLYGGVGADSLIGGTGSDSLYGDGYYGGEGGSDTLDGGAGQDYLVGGYGSDTYLFGKGDGQDLISNAADLWGGVADPTVGKQDVLKFKTGVAASGVTATRTGDDLVLKLNGTTDQVTVSGYFYTDGVNPSGYAIEQIKFSDGTAWSIAQLKTMVLKSTAGNDSITGYETADSLSGAAGQDTLSGRGGNDTLIAGDGDDIIAGDAGHDKLYGGNGFDQLSGGNGNDTLDGAGNDDQLFGDVGADSLVGGAGNDTLAGDGCYGGAGGNDTLDGGAGTDYLVGGFGSDTYLFGKGDGQDTVNNVADAWNGATDPTAGKQDVLKFKVGVAASGVTATRTGDDLILKISGTTDQVTVSGYFRQDGASPSGYAIEQIKFDDGTTWSLAQVKAKVVAGTAGSDSITGYETADSLSGAAGSDTLSGRGGDDTLLAGDGDDFVSGEAGNDRLDGGANDDQLFGDVGADSLIGGAGNDTLAGDGYYGGAGGNDTLDGGAGADHLVGGFGSDTYLFGKGDGQDTISNAADLWNGGPDPTIGKKDVLAFKSGVAASGVTATRSGDDLILKINGTSDQVTVTGYFYLDGASPSGYAIELIKFSDGTAWSVAQVKTMVLKSTAGSDSITGYETADSLTGAAGNDTLSGHGGNDTLSLGDGDDVAYGDAGGDKLDGGNGMDVLSGGEGHDTLDGGANDDQLFGDAEADSLMGGAGNDMLYGDGYYGGNGGNDTLDAGAGNDVLVGGFGSDMYRFGKGDGRDTINNLADLWGGTADPSLGKQDVLRFKAGVVPAGVAATRMNDDLILAIVGTTDQVTISNYFYVDGAGVQGYAVEQIRFDDGTTWDRTSVQALLAAHIVKGTAGNDSLVAGAGHDWVDGGAGGDTMSGGMGDDVFVVDAIGDAAIEAANAGRDTVRSSVSYTLGANLENLVLSGSVAINGNGNALANLLIGNAAANRLSGGAGPDSMSGAGGDDVYGVDNALDAVVEFSGEGVDTIESSVTYALAQQVENITLTGSGATSATGNALNNVLKGNAAANTLSGGEGNDTYYGGAGNDRFVDTSTASSDAYLWGLGHGGDTLSDAGGSLDHVDLGPGIAKSQLRFAQSGNHLRLSISGQSGTLTMNDWFADSSRRIEEFRMSDGSKVLATEVQLLIQAMAAFTAGDASGMSVASAGTHDAWPRDAMLLPPMA